MIAQMNKYCGIFEVIGSINNIKTVLSEGWDINIPCSDSNYTLLNATCSINRCGIEMSECVNYLLDNGADHSITNYYGDTPLLSTCQHGIQSANTIKQLLEAGSDPNHKNYDGNIPLTSTTDLDVIKLLINYGADINKKGKNGITALHYNASLSSGTPYNINFLISRGAEINSQQTNGTTPLMLTSTHQLCFWRSIEAISLIEHGADIHIKNNMGETASSIAEDFLNDSNNWKDNESMEDYPEIKKLLQIYDKYGARWKCKWLD